MGRQRCTPFLFVVLLIVLLTSCVSEPELIKRSKAYIISVGLDYTNTNSYAELLGCPGDSMDIGYCFQDVYNAKNIQNNLTLMLSSGIQASESSINYPTKDNVLNEIRKLKVTEDDLIVFFFSGHAQANANGTADLCMAKLNDGTETFIEMGELYHVLDEKGCACALILDTCYAGTTI